MIILASIKSNLKRSNLFQIFAINTKCLCIGPSQSGQITDNVRTNAPGIEDSTAAQRYLKIAVIGVPNAGKSTFINAITNHRVCPISSKVHTTRKTNKAIYSTGNTQLVFSDTPGLVTEREIKKHNLEKEFISAYRHAIQNSDLIAVLHDVSNLWTRSSLHSSVINALKTYPSKPSILVLNKIDAIKSKRILLDLVRTLTNNCLAGKTSKPKNTIKNGSNEAKEVGWSSFEDIFMISAITGSGIPELQNYLLQNAKVQNWQYEKGCFTDEPPEHLIVASVRARLLDYLPQEIPYNLETSIEYYSEENNTLYASVVVTCQNERIERLICGEANGKLFQITERVTSDLVETFGKAVSLTITTKYKKEKLAN